MFIKRFFTVIVLVPVIIWLILGTSVATFQIITAAFSLWASWEWASLMGIKTLYNKIIYVVLMLGAISIIQFIPFHYILWLALIWWLLAVFILWQYVRKQAYVKKLFLNGLMGLFCIIPGWVGLNILRIGPHGANYVLLFLLLLWAIDTGAYLVGMRFGKRKLVPTLSPGKTIEGVIGGFMGMLIILTLGVFVFHVPPTKWIGLAIVSIVMVFFAIIGDLFESMFKRIAHVKDSGNVFPGHGGILDRMDSLLSAAPIFALGLLVFGIL